MSKKIHIKEVEKYCNEKGYYVGEYWIPNTEINHTKPNRR